MRTYLPAVLRDAARDKQEVQAATLVVVLELAALSLLVLLQVVSGAVEARGDEIALAKLRGLRPSRTVLFALAEPVSLLVLAAPLGLVCALVATHLLTDAALVDGTPVALTGTTGARARGGLRRLGRGVGVRVGQDRHPPCARAVAQHGRGAPRPALAASSST